MGGTLSCLLLAAVDDYATGLLFTRDSSQNRPCDRGTAPVTEGSMGERLE